MTINELIQALQILDGNTKVKLNFHGMDDGEYYEPLSGEIVDTGIGIDVQEITIIVDEC